jgi:hypothetical protein
MNPFHVFEASIADKDTGLGAHFISVPQRYFQGIQNRPMAVLENLGLQAIIDIPPAHAVYAIVALLSHDAELSSAITDSRSDIERHERFARALNRENLQRRIGRKDWEFAQYLAFAPLIPVEHSPLEGLSLDKIVQTGGTGVGAYIGIVVAGTTPLLFITVPVGMIICGAAAGVGLGLFKGLSDRISHLIRGSESQARVSA